jgi:hypothetical protein
MRILFFAGLLAALFLTPADANLIGGKRVLLAGKSKFVGAGDIVVSATAWWGLRAYNLAYAASAGKIALVCTPADATCANVNSDSKGNFNLAGTPSLTCNNGGSICTIKTFFDQSGANSCAGACDLTQATIASRPTLVINCIASLPCALFSAVQTLASVGAAYSQPDTWSIVAKRTSGTVRTSVFSPSSGLQQVGFDTGATNMLCYAGLVPSISGAAEGAFHSFQCILNNPSSQYFLDGSGAGISAGTQNVAASAFAMNSANPGVFEFTEGGLWGVAFSSGQQSSMNLNQHAYWGF